MCKVLCFHTGQFFTFDTTYRLWVQKEVSGIFMTKLEAQWRKRRSDKIRSKMPHIFETILDNRDTVCRVGFQTTELKQKK